MCVIGVCGCVGVVVSVIFWLHCAGDVIFSCSSRNSRRNGVCYGVAVNSVCDDTISFPTVIYTDCAGIVTTSVADADAILHNPT